MSIHSTKTLPLENHSYPITPNGRFFASCLDGRSVMLRGVNLSGSVKQPFTPKLPSHQPEGFFNGKDVSFVGRPFPLEESDQHFARLKLWGFNFLRFNITWEAIEHSGPGIYDNDYINYVVQVLLKAKEYGFKCFIDPHQDVWSRFTGGSGKCSAYHLGAPLWTLHLAGFEAENFNESQAALVQNTHADPSQWPKMIWPTNYWKLATFTMFTLFFGGRVFAPNTIVEGVNIQDYLQNHYFGAICELAKAIKIAGLEDNCVVGYDTLNEPALGLIGVEDITHLAHQQELRKGVTPNAFQAMKLGMGMETEKVEVWDMTSVGPMKMSEKTFDPNGVKAWQVEKSCIWAEHGVWDIQSGSVLIQDYFFRDPKSKKPVDGMNDFWKPFVNRYAEAIRKIHTSAVIFVEPPVNAFPPIWDEGDAPGPLCFAPHWYDGLTLLQKHWNPWLNVDYVGFTRGRYSSIAFAVKFGEAAIKKCFQGQLKILREEGEEALGICPTVFGEIGIPYDLDGKAAYLTGDYSAQSDAMDANMTALERDLLNFTLWNYCTDNSHTWGDQWNGEDLSIWSPPLKTTSPVLKMSTELISHASCKKSVPLDLNDGARALEAFVRPFPIMTPGTPKSLSFDMKTKSFTYSFSHMISDSSVWDPRAQGLSSQFTEIFLPKIHYPSADEIDVWVSCGTYTIHPDLDRLMWKCGCKQRDEEMTSSATANSLNSSSGGSKKGRVYTDECVTHKIVIQRKTLTEQNSKQVGETMDPEEDEDAICPQCSLM